MSETLKSYFRNCCESRKPPNNGRRVLETKIEMAEETIRVRACLAVIHEERILLVPHYDTDKGPVQWNIPGGRVKYGESVRQTAIRELLEETGIQAQVIELLDVSEVLLPDESWHSITITYLGRLVGGEVRAEPEHPFGQKNPQWFTIKELNGLMYHPKETIEKALLR